MLFNSLAFALFAPSFLILYFLSRGNIRLLIILLSSYFFYAWWDWRFISLLMLSTAVDYYVGSRLEKTDNGRVRKLLLTTSISVNLGVLGFFKYFNFFIESFSEMLSSIGIATNTSLLNIILPVGISFYTFQTMSYTIDIYRKRIPAETNLLRFACYVAMFPQLVAGPIVRAADLLPQLRIDHKFEISRIASAIELIFWGFFLKLCLADTAAAVVDPRFTLIDQYGSLSHIAGVIAFSFQIYGDFAGYSLIAIGMGKLMGFDFGINFNRPYFSSSFSEFWTRWHISLSSWLRDYLYIPLGGNRGGRFLTFRNLMITMFLGGLWHGAAWTFVIWGVLHGSFLILQRLLSVPYGVAIKALHAPEWISKLFSVLLVFSLTSFAWIFFRAESLADALRMISIIISFEDFTIGAAEQRLSLIKTAMFILVVVVVDYLGTINGVRRFYFDHPSIRFISMLLIFWVIVLFGTFDGISFIYFQF